MRGARQSRNAQQPFVVRGGTTFYKFRCLNCNVPLESPATESFMCPKCSCRMFVRAGVRMHSVGTVNPPPTLRSSDLSALSRIADLHRSGELTDEEFAELKARLLNGTLES